MKVTVQSTEHLWQWRCSFASPSCNSNSLRGLNLPLKFAAVQKNGESSYQILEKLNILLEIPLVKQVNGQTPHEFDIKMFEDLVE